MGGGWLGGGWQGGGWQGGGWQGGGWMSGGGSDGTFAMRPDRPLVAETADGKSAPKYPAHCWDGDLFSLAFLPDFFTATNAAGQTWDQAITVGNFPNVVMPGDPVAPGDDSIDDLRILAVTERPEAMGEILNQHQNQQLCFMQFLMMTQNSHPATFFAMKLAARIGEVVMIRLKRKFNRPRPSQYYPTLYPPVAVPGHASYPAGHALIANLTAGVLIEVTTDQATGRSPYEKGLTKLADEIGLNRVIAGLHFRSDIAAGADAGRKTHDFLKAIPDPNPAPPQPPYDPPWFNYRTVIARAQDEWK